MITAWKASTSRPEVRLSSGAKALFTIRVMKECGFQSLINTGVGKDPEISLAVLSPGLGKGTRTTYLSIALDSLLLPRGLPSCDSECGRGPSCTPGSWFSTSCKDYDGNQQDTVHSVHEVETGLLQAHASVLGTCRCECMCMGVQPCLRARCPLRSARHQVQG